MSRRIRSQFTRPFWLRRDKPPNDDRIAVAELIDYPLKFRSLPAWRRRASRERSSYNLLF
jgi:hypothetical protein